MSPRMDIPRLLWAAYATFDHSLTSFFLISCLNFFCCNLHLCPSTTCSLAVPLHEKPGSSSSVPPTRRLRTAERCFPFTLCFPGNLGAPLWWPKDLETWMFCQQTPSKSEDNWKTSTFLSANKACQIISRGLKVERSQ